MPTFFQARSFINYWLDAVDEHSLHSPFFFDFYTRIVKGESIPSDFDPIEKLRQQLLRDTQTIPKSNFGVGSIALKDDLQTISDIARVSLSPPKYLRFYHRLIKHFHLKNIVELGTSLGVSTLYLAHGPGTEVTTFEGSPEIAETARITFEFGMAGNVKLVEGNIDTTLSRHLSLCRKIDLAFMDANHRQEATLRYFNGLLTKVHNQSVVILDDIHYSEEMEEAWKEIKKNKLVYGSADLYRCGLVFFDPSLNKQHVVLQF